MRGLSLGAKFLRGRSAIVTATIVAGVVLWTGAAGTGLALLASYSNAATLAAAGPRSWPADTRIAQASGAAHLVIFFHPRCPCSSATLSELNRILARAPALRVTMCFWSPASWDSTESATTLRRRADKMRSARVDVIDDTDGRDAALFGAQSSGHALLYDADGKLRFSGGITASRGHEGSNPGEESIIQILRGEEPVAAEAPTFGCELVGPVPCAACSEGAK